jgi:protein-S-isoprenylcysteine O-methyltransferase Ste14
MPRKVSIALTIEFVLFAIILFGSAGTLDWFAGWVFMILFFGCLWLLVLKLAQRDPALLEERMKMRLPPDQPLWDKILLRSLIVLWLVFLILMGLDAGRFHWSQVPAWLQWVGSAAMLIAFWIFDLTFKENTFATPVVRIQKEREHKVITTGPYSVVRHPLYSGAMLLMPSMALLLGSWYGVIGSLILYTVLVFRTVMEDQTLMRELNGYPEYARRVRYRLIPFVW